MCVCVYKNIHKPPFSHIFKALIFLINQSALVPEIFCLIFCWLLLTRYCFSRKRTCVMFQPWFQHFWCILPAPHCDASSLTVPGASPLLCPLTLKSWATSTFHHHLLDSSLYIPQDPLCALQSDSFHHLYEFWLVFSLLDYLFLARHLNFF